MKIEVRGSKSEVETKPDKTTRRIGTEHRKAGDLVHSFRKVESTVRTRLIGLVLICLCGASPAAELRTGEVDPGNIPRLQPHYQPEFAFGTATDPASWARERPGLQVAFGSADELYSRCEVPVLKQPAASWEASGWRGERLNAQVLVWAADAQEQVRVRVSELRSDRGAVIPGNRVRTRLVRYVLSNLPYQAKGFSCDVTNSAAYLLPDRLEDFDRFDLPARTVRPLWLSVDIPPNAKPGDYSGTVQVHSASNQAALPLKIHVQPQKLPEPRDWRFRLDLWQNPWVVSSYFQVEPWSEEHKALLRKHLKPYADAGGKYITTYTVHSPWSDNSYVLEGTMIDWVKTTGGAWRFDYAIFDE